MFLLNSIGWWWGPNSFVPIQCARRVGANLIPLSHRGGGNELEWEKGKFLLLLPFFRRTIYSFITSRWKPGREGKRFSFLFLNQRLDARKGFLRKWFGRKWFPPFGVIIYWRVLLFDDESLIGAWALMMMMIACCLTPMNIGWLLISFRRRNELEGRWGNVTGERFIPSYIFFFIYLFTAWLLLGLWLQWWD